MFEKENGLCTLSLPFFALKYENNTSCVSCDRVCVSAALSTNKVVSFYSRSFGVDALLCRKRAVAKTSHTGAVLSFFGPIAAAAPFCRKI